MSKPTIRHIAIMSRDTDKLAQFYKDVFEMEEVHRSKGVDGIPAVYLSDGYLTLAVLPCSLKRESPAGFNHFGFQIDNTAEYSSRIVAYGLEEAQPRPSNRPFAEHRACDPDGNMFDLSEHGYGDVEYRSERDARAKELEKA
jgi:catechol 2,3-dioxygenase-like lactoylglutathione lyase family enzyme